MKVTSPPMKVISPPTKVASPPTKVASPPTKVASPPTNVASPPTKVASPPKKVASPPTKVASPPTKMATVPTVISPPPKPTRADSKHDESMITVAPRSVCREQPRDGPFRPEKLSLVAAEADGPNENADLPLPDAVYAAKGEDSARNEESNGVGDKIKIFEKAAEDAATAGRASRTGSVRRPRTERLPSDELPPPPVSPDLPAPPPERPRTDPQRIVRPEFRPLASPAEVTIRSPSLGAKAPERFPSRGTAFRNVSATAAPPPDSQSDADEPSDAGKTCKFRGRERPTASRGSSYFTRGSEEIWLVKKKDIEEIEERVLDSFRRAGVRGGVDTCGRGRRGYARSESLEPARGAGEWAGRAHTLKRQASVACTCGHDKKTRARHDTTPRPRSRSHGDPTDATVLDKYETLV